MALWGCCYVPKVLNLASSSKFALIGAKLGYQAFHLHYFLALSLDRLVNIFEFQLINQLVNWAIEVICLDRCLVKHRCDVLFVIVIISVAHATIHMFGCRQRSLELVLYELKLLHVNLLFRNDFIFALLAPHFLHVLVVPRCKRMYTLQTISVFRISLEDCNPQGYVLSYQWN